jgi:hypothetical protein
MLESQPDDFFAAGFPALASLPWAAVCTGAAWTSAGAVA